MPVLTPHRTKPRARTLSSVGVADACCPGALGAVTAADTLRDSPPEQALATRAKPREAEPRASVSE